VLEAGVLERMKLICSLLRDAEMWRAQGVMVPRSLLLTGPPGVGKTEIDRTLANEGGLGFLATTTADVKANFLGQSGNRVKQLFERASAGALLDKNILREEEKDGGIRMRFEDPFFAQWIRRFAASLR
jgi:AAA+ superfamily predicted ATPase